MAADRSACHLFKQTRVNLDWTEKRANSTIDIPLPQHAGRSNRSLSIRKRAKPQEHPDTEEKFKLAHHASAASIYYRPVARFPRCILWRIVEDLHVLSVAAVDFTKPESHAEMETTFRFVFPEPIQLGTVGFADALGRDELVIYALTRDGVLYTLNLAPDFLLRNSFLKRGSQPSDYCTTYYPSAFTLHSPHFLLPIDHESLIIPLQDGNILKLDRNHKTIAEYSDPSVASYSEKTFSDSGYFGFLKNKMPWVGAGTVQYGQGSVTDTTVVSAIAYTPTIDRPDTKPLLFTVSVDHSLKVWSLEQECLLRATDLLNDPQSAPVKMKTWLDPSPSHLLAVLDQSHRPDHSFYLVSFSSAATGKFKFWASTCYEDGQPDGQFKDLIDLYPEDTFETKPPSTIAPWIISEFRVTPVPSDSSGLFDLWVLWKSDTNFQIQNVRFDIKDVRGTWGQWTTATSDTLHNLPRQATFSETSEEISEHWRKWVFYPGRFPDTVLESALRIYENNFLVPTGASSTSESIQARVPRIVSASVQASKGLLGKFNPETHRQNTDSQWDRFSRLCVELDKQRREALSLVSDPVTGFVWTVNVDGITALRECTETEMIWHNFSMHGGNLETLIKRTEKRLGAGLGGKDLSDTMVLVSAANELGESLSEGAFENCIIRLQAGVVEDPLYSVLDLMWTLYEHCLEQEVPDETHEKIEGLFGLMHDPEAAFHSVMSSLFHHPDTRTGSARLTAFGAKVLVGGTQEVIHVNYELLFRLVFLLVYVNFADETKFSKISRPESVYSQLLVYFREYEIFSWMARTSAQLVVPPVVPDDDISQALTDLRVSDDTIRQGKRGSVLQLVLPDEFGPSPPRPGRIDSVSLSVCIRKFLASLELSDNSDGITNVALALLNVNAAEPAVEFSKFLPSTAWGTYMKGRVQLKARSHDTASKHFNKAAYGMSVANRSAFSATEILLPELKAVGSGLSRYHLHVATLFEEEQALEYVIDSCNTALLAAEAPTDTQLMSEILLKYFRAAVKVSLFDEAYMALGRYTDAALRHSAVRDLVTAMVEKDQGAKLCSYPWIGFQDEVDEALSFKCQQILDISAGPPFHKVLYSWRIQRGDYRGAAYILYERLQRLQTANIGSTDPNSRVVTDGYLALINVLSCVGEDQAWILSDMRADGNDGVTDRSTKRPKLDGKRPTNHLRKVLTLADIKAEYQTEVERVGLLLNGGFFV